MKGGAKTFWFIIHLLFGLYFINSAFQWINIISLGTEIGKWITFAGGVLILLGGFYFLRATRYSRY